MMGIGKRIKEARENLNLTQKELGELVGVTGSAITNYENETSHPKEMVLYKLLEVLNVDANFLFQDCFIKTKAPVSDKPETEADALKIYNAFVSAGLIKKLDDLTPEQIDGLLGIFYILSALFDQD